MGDADLTTRRLELLYKIGVALSAERNKDRLLEMILMEAKQLCNADGGTLYLKTGSDTLRFAIMRTDSLGIALGGTTGEPIDLPDVPMFDPTTGAPNRTHLASAAVIERQSINIPDAYDAIGFDFSGTRTFDEHNNYRSKSCLAIPLVNMKGQVLGVLQLLNARTADGNVIAFDIEQQRAVEALASQAAVSLDNKLLFESQEQLLESFIKLIAEAIDAKSRYTGAHCERVPILTEMLTRSLCDASDGPFAKFDLSSEEWRELRIAAWLHDCGKVTTPVHVMDKATKLETIFDRIELVKLRLEILQRDAEIAYLKAAAETPNDTQALRATYEERVAYLRQTQEFLETVNRGGEFLAPEKQLKIRDLRREQYRQAGELHPLLSDEECDNLAISRGTLTDEERLIINGHMVQTVRMLEALPFPTDLRRVPEYACGHHERMDGNGYPRGIFAGDMSIPARVMAVADVFEALTAQDRPYKQGKPLSESMRIMGIMKHNNHLDPDILDHFVRSGVYRDYAKRYLPAELIDEVDEAALLAIEPKPYELPDESVRRERWQGFLAEYERL